MNEAFFIGKIISNIDFKFIVESKHIAISNFLIKTLDNQIIYIKAYDELADFIYSKMKLDDIVFINGFLSQKSVIVKKITKFN